MRGFIELEVERVNGTSSPLMIRPDAISMYGEDPFDDRKTLIWFDPMGDQITVRMTVQDFEEELNNSKILL